MRRGRTTRGGGLETCRRGRRCRRTLTRHRLRPDQQRHPGHVRGVPTRERPLCGEPDSAGRQDRPAQVGYQMVHHDVWNYDTSTAPIVMDVNVGGRRVPGVFQATNRRSSTRSIAKTGEPSGDSRNGRCLPRRYRRKSCPRRNRSRSSRRRTIHRPERRAPDRLDARIKALALKRAKATNAFLPPFNPPTRRGDPAGPGRFCPGEVGGTNITHPPAADRPLGSSIIPSGSGCGSREVVPGTELDCFVRPARRQRMGADERRCQPGSVAAAIEMYPEEAKKAGVTLESIRGRGPAGGGRRRRWRRRGTRARRRGSRRTRRRAGSPIRWRPCRSSRGRSAASRRST